MYFPSSISTEAIKENFPYNFPYLLIICPIFLEKVTRSKSDKGKRRISTYKHTFIQVLVFMSRFLSRLLLIRRINLITKEQIKIHDIYQESII